MNDIVVTKAYTTYIAKAPLYYVRSGYVDLNLGRSRGSGVNGYYWSPHSHSTLTNAYLLYFYAVAVSPSGYSYRYYPFSLRCYTT